jgi:hypothetical protein
MEKLINLNTRLENLFEEYLIKKAPKLPPSWKKNLVSLIPYITLIFFVFGLPIFLAFFGISFFLLSFSFSQGASGGIVFMLNLILSALSLALTARAIPELFKRKALGWKLVYWSLLISLATNILTFNILGLLVLIIPLYLIFQIRDSYH